MKKLAIIFLICGMTATVFAEEISELYKEFQRRDDIVFTQNQVRVLTFLTRLPFDTKSIEKLELIDPNDPTEFLMEIKNGDICLGNIDRELLRCKNAMGITSVEYSGDAD